MQLVCWIALGRPLFLHYLNISLGPLSGAVRLFVVFVLEKTPEKLLTKSLDTFMRCLLKHAATDLQTANSPL
jgi:hypothetical protein